MLTGFRMQYPDRSDDHQAGTLRVGVCIADSGSGYAIVDGIAWLSGTSGHRQDDTLSHVGALVIGSAA